MAWAVSGSVGLELMVEALPTVVLYKIKRFDLWVARRFIKSKYISLVNLLADDEVFPEYLTWRDVSDDLVRWALAWLDDSEARPVRPRPWSGYGKGAPSPAPRTAPPEQSPRGCSDPRGTPIGRGEPHPPLPIMVPTSSAIFTSGPTSPSRGSIDRLVCHSRLVQVNVSPPCGLAFRFVKVWRTMQRALPKGPRAWM